MTAVEWLVDKILVQQELCIDEEGEWTDTPIIQYINGYKSYVDLSAFVHEAKEIEKTNLDNKVIHFAEWLTKKHTTTLMALYEHFEEEHYKEKL